MSRLLFRIVLGLAITSAKVSSAAVLTGFAAMGASETAGRAYSGSWVPFLAVDRGLNFGPNQSYNRAVGGATTSSLLTQGQHTAVKTLVESGSVDLSFLFIGANDVGPVALQLASGTLNGQTWANGMVSRILTAADTVLAAGPDGMVVAGLPDMTLVPAAQTYLPLLTPPLRQNLLNAFELVNTQLKQEVLDRGIVFLDIAQAMRDLNAEPLVVGGVNIDTVNASADPTHFFQDALHPAVVGNGIFANLMITALNVGYDQSISLISDQLMLQKAGLSTSYRGETSNIDYAKYVYTAVPESSSTLMLITVAVSAISWRFFARKPAQHSTQIQA
jgi:lysophospholipase L1-like esterase